MWRRLQEAGICGKMHRLIRSLYIDCSSVIITDIGLSDWFPVQGGTRQGAVLSPFLFSLVISPLADLLPNMNMGTSFGPIRIGCLLFADDIVLIADSAQELQAIMNAATVFFRKWRFQVSSSKTRVVSLGHCETRDLQRRFWRIGGCIVQDVASYTYLGIDFDKSGNWLVMLRHSIDRCRSSMGHLHTLVDADSFSLPILQQLATLWGLFARSRLLYGAEVWSSHSASSRC